MPKIVNTEEKQFELIAASWDVIAEDGFRGLTMRSVASRAGCTTGSVTHYFSDRLALLVGSLRAAHHAAGQRMSIVADAADNDFQRLHSVLLEALPLDAIRLREWKVWLAFWGASMGEPVLAAENAQRYAEWRSAVEVLLRPLTQSDKADAEILVALIDGLGLRIARNTYGPKQLEKEQSECKAAIVRYLAKYES